MRSPAARFTALVAASSFLFVGCYNSYRITTEELEFLQSGNIAEFVPVQTDSGTVEVSATTPITVVESSGERHSVSAFNFSLSDTQLVAPDYDLLLPRDDVSGAIVQQFAKGKTIAAIFGSILIAGGAFAAVSILAPAERGLGGE